MNTVTFRFRLRTSETFIHTMRLPQRRSCPWRCPLVLVLVLVLPLCRLMYTYHMNKHRQYLLGRTKDMNRARRCVEEAERSEACRDCRPGPGEQTDAARTYGISVGHDTPHNPLSGSSCGQFCSAGGRCGSSKAHQHHDCRDRAARAASARATAEAWHADGRHERFDPLSGRQPWKRFPVRSHEPAKLQVCYFELSACEFKQNPGAPWTVRVFMNGSKAQALCGKTMPLRDTYCKRDGALGVIAALVAWLGDLFAGGPPTPEPISFMLEYADDATLGPTPLVENEWAEFTPRSAAVARVGIRAHTLQHYCGLHIIDKWGHHTYKDLDDNDIARRRASGGITLRIPTTAGLVVIEAGPAASFPKPAPPVPATRLEKLATPSPHSWHGPGPDSANRWRLDPDLRTPLLPENLPVTGFFHRASAAPAGKDITLCTQMDTLGLPFLPRLASQWGGPLSVVLYLVPWQTAAEVRQQLLSNPVYRPVLKHADIHLVKADLAKALFPINALRNLAIDRARTDLVWLIEADMLVPAGVRLRLMQEHLPRMLSQPDTAWIVPLFESPKVMSSSFVTPDSRPVFQTKAELLADIDWKPCEYESHDYMREDGRAWNSKTEPFFVNITNEQEPYYVVDRRATVRHDPRLGWLHPSFGYGPNADKLSQVREQRRLTRFVILPDAFLLRYRGWNRSKLALFQEKWDKDHAPTPTMTRRYATFRNPERACRLYHRLNRDICL